MRLDALALALLVLSGLAAPLFARTEICPDGDLAPRADRPRTTDRVRDDMVLSDERVKVEVVGAVAKLEVRQTYRFDGQWPDPGEEAVSEQRTSHLSALYDYWITELGRVHRGIVRDQGSARAEYNANLAQRRDPGLVEWIEEGRYRLSLYPVPKNRGTKDQGYTLLQVLPVGTDGMTTLRYELPAYRVERSRWRVSFATPPSRLVSNLRLTQVPGEPSEFIGELSGLPVGEKQVRIAYDLGAGAHPLAWTNRSGTHVLAVTRATPDPDRQDRDRFEAYLAPATHLMDGVPGAVTSKLSLPDAWCRTLESSALAVASKLDDNRAESALQIAREAAIVGPGVVLFANPFTTRERVEAGWEAAQAAAASEAPYEAKGATTGGLSSGMAAPRSASATPAYRPVAPPVRSSSRPSIFFDIPSLAVPNFKAARERAGTRACFANQKIVAGAVEMYNLDHNCRAESHLWKRDGTFSPARLIPRYREDRTEHWEPYALPFDLKLAGLRGLSVSRWRHGLRHTSKVRMVVGHYELPACNGQHEPLPARAVVRITEAFFEVLRTTGYLQSVPDDPGIGPDSCENYCLTTFENGAFCLVHGGIEDGQRTPAREQLVIRGVTDPEILSEAWNVHAPRSRRSDEGWIFSLMVMYALIMAVAGTLGLFRFRNGCRADLRIIESGHAYSAVRWLFVTVLALMGGPLALIPLGVSASHAGLVSAAFVWIMIRKK